MDCGTEPYPLSSAINAGGSCFIDALPENTIQGTVDAPACRLFFLKIISAPFRWMDFSEWARISRLLNFSLRYSSAI